MHSPLSIQFGLLPLSQVRPAGEPGQEYLSWFWLTDGWYQISVNGQAIYRPLEVDNPGDPMQTHVDYPVVRLWEDWLDLLPSVLQAVPLALFQCFESVDTLAQLAAVSFEADDEAMDWLWCRMLVACHLRNAPRLYVVRHGSQVRICVLSSPGEQAAPWHPVRCVAQMSVERFLAETRQFHARLMNAMAAQIHDLQQHNPLPRVVIDMPALLREHVERQKSLAQALAGEAEPMDWDAILEANRRLFPQLPFS